MKLEMTPIGYFHTIHNEKYHLQRQGGLFGGYDGKVVLESNKNFEQALEDLDGFDKVWLIYFFHKNSSWKPKVLPPRGGKKKGLFATRSPHRPNSIGITAVTLLHIDRLTLYVQDHDIIDGTPILDIKPYVNYCDNKCSEKQGWIESLPKEHLFEISFTELAIKQLQFLLENASLDLEFIIAQRLASNPFPYKNNRIRCTDENGALFVLAIKTWRIEYQLDLQNKSLNVLKIRSGYDSSTLSGFVKSKWDDVPLHQSYCQVFGVV